MKYYKKIIEFRRAYRKLHYENGKTKLWKLREWCKKWCEDNGIDKADSFLYMDLVEAYADKDIMEKFLYTWLKKQRSTDE